MKRRDYEVIDDTFELSPEESARAEAAVEQAERDVPPARGSLHDLRDRRRRRPLHLMTAAFATVGLLVGVAGVAPWWAQILFGAVHFGVLVALRMSLRDHFLALTLGVDAIVPEGRKPKILVVVPDPPTPERRVH